MLTKMLPIRSKMKPYLKKNLKTSKLPTDSKSKHSKNEKKGSPLSPIFEIKTKYK